jgi:hypothetical protein
VSTWTGPGGLRLGLSLTDLEKLNRKPFKLRGFDKDKTATVSDWDHGALAALAGGCKVRGGSGDSGSEGSGRGTVSGVRRRSVKFRIAYQARQVNPFDSIWLEHALA